jgi:PIN domain nuclease of toxin-antitoxin system
LSPTARAAIEDPNNAKAVSPASYWEIAIKLRLGKYQLTETYDEFIQHAIYDNGFDILAIEPRHTSVLVTLPMHHKDPFDRLMIAQVIVEGLGIVSADAVLDAYGIPRIW